MIYILLIIGIFIVSTAQVLMKLGVNSPGFVIDKTIILKIITTPYLLSGFVLYGIGSIMWLYLLKKLPLSVAYPTMSLSYIIVILLSYFIFKEPLAINKIIGIFLIISGLVVIYK